LLTTARGGAAKRQEGRTRRPLRTHQFETGKTFSNLRLYKNGGEARSNRKPKEVGWEKVMTHHTVNGNGVEGVSGNTGQMKDFGGSAGVKGGKPTNWYNQNTPALT